MSNLFINESYSFNNSSTTFSGFDLFKYVDSSDVYNSFILFALSQLNDLIIKYTITKYANRLDLIAEDIYSDSLYISILKLLNPNSSFELNEIIDIIDLEKLNTLKDTILSATRNN